MSRDWRALSCWKQCQAIWWKFAEVLDQITGTINRDEAGGCFWPAVGLVYYRILKVETVPKLKIYKK
jgi:hypothetical protein